MVVQGKMRKRNEIPVTYLCWGCGSIRTVYEETDIPIPAKEVWNLCPECRLHDETTETCVGGKSVPQSGKAIKGHGAT